jgi:hypothetical protein
MGIKGRGGYESGQNTLVLNQYGKLVSANVQAPLRHLNVIPDNS